MNLAKIDPAWAWEPYEPNADVPWSRELAAHLYRRAGFGATTEQLEEASNRHPQEVVQSLLEVGDTKQFDQEMKAFSQLALASRNSEGLPATWLYRMLHTPDQLLEKTTLFWHGHFATSAAKVTDVRAMVRQNDLLRRFAKGDFEQLVQKISRDPAMLIYLDSTENRKTHPNETMPAN